MAKSVKKKYEYLKKANTLPNGTRKNIYGKTQAELDILPRSGLIFIRNHI